MFAAVLDTCVLWPGLQRDFLLSLAIEGLYRPLWSDAILDELETHEAYKLVRRHDIDPETAAVRAKRMTAQMQAVFDDALVEGWEPHEGTFGLQDPDDEHVLATAFVGGAGAIVTDNVRHFPQSAVPNHIRIIKPPQFAADTVAVSPETALRAVEAIVARRRRPPVTVDEVLDSLVRLYGMHEAVDLLRLIR